MLDDTKVVGKIGEDIAEAYLRQKGYKILARNWRTKWGEIDIIAELKVKNEKLKILVFVEVKTKRGEDFGMPEEMVNRQKLDKVMRMAQMYLRGKEVAARIDVVAIVLGREDKVVRMEHYENVDDV